MTETQVAQNLLMGQFVEGDQDFQILGYMIWWNVRNVNITQEEFKQALVSCGFDEKYAREHNYRSALTRSLRAMEEQRIIRLADEDDRFMNYQFTAELKNGTGAEAELSYSREASFLVDKQRYRETKDFSAAVTCSVSEIKDRVVEEFGAQKVTYSSSDVTRYIKSILRENADIVSLRDQGCVYFVPAAYEQTVRNLAEFLGTLGGGNYLSFFPMPNVAHAQEVVGNAASTEFQSSLENLEKKISEVTSGNKDVGDKWLKNKLEEIAKIKARIGSYEHLIAGGVDDLRSSLDKARESILGHGRKLDLD